MPELKLENTPFVVTVNLGGEDEKISLEEYFLIESVMKGLLQDVQMFDWKDKD